MTYVSSKAQSGKGTVVSIGPIAGTSSPTYVPISEVKSCSPQGAEFKTADTTNFASSAEEFIGTISGTGTANMMGNRVITDAGQVALAAASTTGYLYMFKIQLPINPAVGQTVAGDVLTFVAIVSPSDIELDTEKAITFSVKLKISGAITTVAGT
jgi:hypothetical protein